MGMLNRIYALGQARNEWLDQAAIDFHVDKADEWLGKGHLINSKPMTLINITAAELASAYGIESASYIDYCKENHIGNYTLDKHKELHP